MNTCQSHSILILICSSINTYGNCQGYHRNHNNTGHRGGPGEADTYAIRIASTNPDFCSYEDTRNIDFFKSGDYVIDNLPPSLMYNIEVRSEVAAIDEVWLEANSPGVNVSASTGITEVSYSNNH